MISVELALKSICGKSKKELREFTYNRILGTDIGSFGSGHSTEPNEDVIIQLLRNPELDIRKRKAIIKGLIDVYREVEKLINKLDYIEDFTNVVIRLCRVIDVVQLPEFKKYVRQFVNKLLGKEFCPADLLGAAVRANMAYARDEKDANFWEGKILTNKDVAAYGFNALLDIDAKHPRIEKHLYELWCLQIEKNWPVDVIFLIHRAIRLSNDKNLGKRILQKLKNTDYSLWEKIEKKLKGYLHEKWLKEMET